MKYQLNKKDTDRILSFIQEKGIAYYDIQLELTDHLASDVEQRLEQNPDLLFDDALQSAFNTFGEDGFREIEYQKKQSVRQRNIRLWNKTFLSFFTWPLIAFSFIAYILFLYIFLNMQHDIVARILTVILYFLFLGLAVTGVFKTRQRKEKLLLLQAGSGFDILMFLICFPYFPLSIFRMMIRVMHSETTYAFLAATTMTLWLIVILVFIRTKNSILRQAKELYPEAFS